MDSIKIKLRKYGEMIEGNWKEMSASEVVPASLDTKENVFCSFKFCI